MMLLSLPTHPAGYQSAGISNGTSGGSAISPEGWLFNICLEKRRCKIDPQFGLSQVRAAEVQSHGQTQMCMDSGQGNGGKTYGVVLS